MKRNLFRLSRLGWPALLVLWLLLTEPGAALAAEAGHGDGWVLFKDFLYRSVNFALLAGLLGYFLRKPLGQILAARREALATSLREARRGREEAEARATMLARQLEAGGRELDQLRRQLEEETARERDRLLEQAEQTAAAIRREAGQQADRQIERALRELRAEAAALAIQLAEQQLAAGLTPADQQRLVDETIKQMGERQ